MNIFNDDQDYRVFLSRLRENLYPNRKAVAPEGALQGLRGKGHTPYLRKLLPEGAFSLVAYCLMPNHFHLLLRQNTSIPLSKLILKVCTSYSKYFNKKCERIGALFQDRFKTEHVGKNEYLLWLSSYIHLNPRIANLVKKDLDWRWSSYPEYMDHFSGDLCDKKIILEQFGDTKSYKKAVERAFAPIKSRKEPNLDILNVEFEFP